MMDKHSSIYENMHSKSVGRKNRVIVKENHGEIIITKKSVSQEKSAQRDGQDFGIDKRSVIP